MLLILLGLGCGLPSRIETQQANVTKPAQPVLRIKLDGARSAKGSYSCAVFDNESDFVARANSVASENLELSEQVETDTVWEVRDLPPGRYAVAVFHDENGNRKLDRHMLGYPTEAYGFSNNARGRLGPPTFAQAAFEFGEQDLELKISVK